MCTGSQTASSAMVSKIDALGFWPHIFKSFTERPLCGREWDVYSDELTETQRALWGDWDW
jgi:hypothetical protein